MFRVYMRDVPGIAGLMLTRRAGSPTILSGGFKNDGVFKNL